MLMDIVREQQAKLHSLVGSGSVSFESPEMAGSASFTITLKKPDSLLARFEGPFGIDVGTLFLSRDSYVMYNSFENTAVTGRSGTSALRSVIPFDLTVDEILGVFSGMFNLPADTTGLREYIIDEDHFRMTFTCGVYTCTYWIDPTVRLVSKYRLTGVDGGTTMEASLSSFRELDDAVLPRRIAMTFPEQRRRLSVSYGAVTLNGGSPSFAFSIPSNAHTIVR